MGIILFPFLLAAFGTGLFSLIRSFLLVRSKKLGVKELLLALLISLAIFGGICWSYNIQGRAWALSSVFRISIYMFIVPFVGYILTGLAENRRVKYVSRLLLVSVAISAIVSVIFNRIFFELTSYLGIEIYY